METNFKWKNLGKKDYQVAEKFLINNEFKYVGACSRFLNRNKKDEFWALCSPVTDEIYAMAIYSKKLLYPVLPGCHVISDEIINKPIYSIQGPINDVIMTEEAAKKKSIVPAESVNYDLMTLDSTVNTESIRCVPENLVLRLPVKKDFNDIFFLQAGYEKEEVLPAGSLFNPTVCKSNLEKMLQTEEMMLACFGSRVVGKINTNAKSFTRYQIGGVYIKPEYRGIGIATKMTAGFTEYLLKKNRGVSLFVKKTNANAKRVYTKVGFTVKGDYRISYY